MNDYERDDLVVGVADALTLHRRVHWDRCERLATPANRWVLDNLRAFSDIFAGVRVDTGEASQGWRSRSEPYAGSALGFAVRALVVFAAVEVVAALVLVGWGWEVLRREYGDLFVYLAVLLAGHSAAACLLLFGGRRDRRTWLLGVYFLLKATLVSPFFLLGPLQGVQPAEPFGYVYFGRVYFYPFMFAPAFLWAFARECPRVHHRTPLDDLARRMVWVSAAVGCVNWLGGVALLELARTGRMATGVFWTIFEASLVVMNLLALAAVAVVLLRAHLAPRDEARRVVVFGCGFLMILGLVTAQAVVEVFSPESMLPGIRLTPAVAAMLLLRFPGVVLLWYSVVAVRVPHPREALRLAGRRLLLRGRLLAVAALSTAVMLGWLVASRPERTVGAALADPLLQVLGAAAVTLLLVAAARERVLARLEARLFPEAADQRQAVAEAAAALARAGKVVAVSQTVSRTARRGCGSPAALMVAADGASAGREFVAPDGTTAPLARASAVVHMLETAGGSVRVDPHDETSLFALLPPDDAAWVVESGADAVVPVPGPGAELLGVLVVGRRLDGRAVRRHDLPFLAALGAAAGLAVARLRLMRAPGAASREAPPAAECPECNGVTDAGDPPACGCGSALVEAEVPKLLAGKYRVTRALGRGGMGAAYLARDLQLERDVAVKTLKGLSMSGLMGLKPEAWAMATVTHPAVAHIYGVESWRGRPCLVVEYLAGGTLADRLRRGPLPPMQAVAVAEVLADALAALHETGYLHGDVKPSNVGLTAAGSSKLLDFGLAHAPNGDAAPGGTLCYLSPEALSGHAAEAADDVWSLCVVLYEMVAGEHPFAGGGVDEIADRIRRRRLAAPARPRAGTAGRSAAVLAFAASLLTAPRPARPATARAFARALAGVLPAAGDRATPQGSA